MPGSNVAANAADRKAQCLGSGGLQAGDVQAVDTKTLLRGTVAVEAQLGIEPGAAFAAAHVQRVAQLACPCFELARGRAAPGQARA
jgi:hypothetical protein